MIVGEEGFEPPIEVISRCRTTGMQRIRLHRYSPIWWKDGGRTRIRFLIPASQAGRLPLPITVHVLGARAGLNRHIRNPQFRALPIKLRVPYQLTLTKSPFSTGSTGARQWRGSVTTRRQPLLHGRSVGRDVPVSHRDGRTGQSAGRLHSPPVHQAERRPRDDELLRRGERFGPEQVDRKGPSSLRSCSLSFCFSLHRWPQSKRLVKILEIPPTPSLSPVFARPPGIEPGVYSFGESYVTDYTTDV